MRKTSTNNNNCSDFSHLSQDFSFVSKINRKESLLRQVYAGDSMSKIRVTRRETWKINYMKDEIVELKVVVLVRIHATENLEHQRSVKSRIRSYETRRVSNVYGINLGPWSQTCSRFAPTTTENNDKTVSNSIQIRQLA